MEKVYDDHEMWCKLCNEKMVQTSVKSGVRKIPVCNHCADLWVDQLDNEEK